MVVVLPTYRHRTATGRCARLTRGLAATAACLALVHTQPAHAHSGKAVPVVAVHVAESGPLRAVVDVRAWDQDGGEPIRDAEVTGGAVMTRPHTMYTYFGPLPEVSPGRYRASVKLPMAARWSLEITVGGAEVVPRKARATVTITRTALPAASSRPATSGKRRPSGGVLVGDVHYDVSGREVRDMVLLWVHGLAAMAWIVGLALLLLAVTAGSGALAPDARERLAWWYRRWGMPMTWAAAAVVVVTGIYNMRRVAPFELVWRPARLDDLGAIPYGRLYEALLAAKLSLFVVMVVAGLAATVRARRSWDTPAGQGSTFRVVARRLGVSGVVFLACAPAIIAAVVALRYVHILSHVAEASQP